MRKYYQRRLPEDPSKDYYYIIRETNPMQSLLVEYGFIDNANDQKKLEDDLLDYVEAVVRAISQYAGYPYIAPSGSNTYTVKSGDSLWSIANKFNISVAELKEYNNLSSNNLSIGQILKIPTTNNDNSNSGNQTIYTVKRGDSLWSIASNYGVSVADLRKANNLTSDTLTIGQVLKIPIIGNNDGNVDTGTSTTYIVKRGDNLYSIARKYNVSVDAIKRANNLESDVLSLNQVLIIPNQENNNNSSNDSANTGTITYTVKRGDSLWSIANNYGISVLELKAANNLTSNLLNVGQTLIIPSSSTNANYFNYTVKSGDSLWSIANQFGVSVLDIKNINNLTSNLLVIGQILKIPNS